MWAFWDDDEYKERPNLVQLKGSTTSTACTTPNVLFPFFAVHIPDIDREDIRRQLESYRLRNPEQRTLSWAVRTSCRALPWLPARPGLTWAFSRVPWLPPSGRLRKLPRQRKATDTARVSRSTRGVLAPHRGYIQPFTTQSDQAQLRGRRPSANIHNRCSHDGPSECHRCVAT
jgi:hypothetical protein